MSLLRLLSFRGRSSRRTWWAVVISVAVAEASMSAWLTGEPFPLDPRLPADTKAIGGLLRLATIWPVVAVSVRRARDLNHSGWTVVWLWAVYVLGGLAFAFLSHWTGVAAAIAGVSAQVWIAFNLGLRKRRDDAAVGDSMSNQADASGL
ncbi:DUF805 domain-containing protein [Phenylobacterium sp.]|uniref:DUF805 domain-containing protein n=1 Tax=Phenylobacterium sp. TaxID=1871053 RepID=UPI00351F88FF